MGVTLGMSDALTGTYPTWANPGYIVPHPSYLAAPAGDGKEKTEQVPSYLAPYYGSHYHGYYGSLYPGLYGHAGAYGYPGHYGYGYGYPGHYGHYGHPYAHRYAPRYAPKASDGEADADTDAKEDGISDALQDPLYGYRGYGRYGLDRYHGYGYAPHRYGDYPGMYGYPGASRYELAAPVAADTNHPGLTGSYKTWTR